MFTREDTSSLPVPETKFNGSEGEMLGQLVVTPEVVAIKINNMKENKSPGVDNNNGRNGSCLTWLATSWRKGADGL